MADKLQDTAPAVQNKTALREEILKNIEKKVESDPELRDLSDKFGEDVKRLINETTNFYSGLGVALTADQLADQILKTKLPKYNPKNQTNSQPKANPIEKNNNDRETNPSNQEVPRKITPKTENPENVDPYREQPENNQTTDKNENNVEKRQTEKNPGESNPGEENNITKIPPISPSQTKEGAGGDNEPSQKEGLQTQSAETNSNTKSNAVPPKLNYSGGNRGGGKREGGSRGDDNNGDDKEPPKIGQKNNLGQNLKNIKNVLSQNKNPKKLSLAIWIMLGLGAVMIDFAQGALAPTLLALVVNMLADIFVGLALFTFFWFHKMLNRKLIISLLLGFLVDFVSLGIMPAWSFDIAYAWFVTDGANVIAKVPGAGEKAEELVQKIASKKA